MLVEQISNDVDLMPYICESCRENDIELVISSDIDNSSMVILKMDDYYSTKRLKKPPPAADCLVIRRCIVKNHFHISIAELKNINAPKKFSVENMKNKFLTVLNDFMLKEYAHYFYNDNIKIKTIKLYFISDPYGWKHKKQRLTSRNHRIDFLMSVRIPKFFGLNIYIEHKLPNPAVKPCQCTE